MLPLKIQTLQLTRERIRMRSPLNVPSRVVTILPLRKQVLQITGKSVIISRNYRLSVMIVHSLL